MTDVISWKLERLRGGGRPRALDLFSGCGGIMLGFHRAGCESIGGVDIDPHAALSYATNFHSSGSSELFSLHATPKDITKVDPLTLLRSYGFAKPRWAVDVLIGGPPCPAFARIGRAKLREIHD